MDGSRLIYDAGAGTNDLRLVPSADHDFCRQEPNPFFGNQLHCEYRISNIDVSRGMLARSLRPTALRTKQARAVIARAIDHIVHAFSI